MALEIEEIQVSPSEETQIEPVTSNWEIDRVYVMPQEEMKDIPAPPPNFLNKVVESIRELFGWEKEKIYSFMEGIDDPEDLEKKYGEKAKEFYWKQIKGITLNTLTFGIYPAPPEIIPPEEGTEKALFWGGMALGGLLPTIAQTFVLELATAGLGGVPLLGRLLSATDKVTKLSMFRSLPKTSKLIAKSLPLAGQMAKAGAELGTVGFMQTLINANEATNNIWEAIKEANEEAIHMGLFGAGFPVIGKFSSPIKRAILANALGNIMGYFVEGKTDISTIWHYLATSDVSPDDFYNALYNTALNTFFGAVASKHDNVAKESLETVKIAEESRKVWEKPEIKVKEDTEKIIKKVEEKKDVGVKKIDEDVSLIGKEEKAQEIIKEITDEFKYYQFKHEKAMEKILEGEDIKIGKLIEKGLSRQKELEQISHNMMGNKNQILNKVGYEAILERGLIGSKHIVDWFAGTGKVTYVIKKYLPELSKDKTTILNELFAHRNAVLKFIFGEETKKKEFLEALERTYVEAGQKAIELVKKYKKELSNPETAKEVVIKKVRPEWDKFIKEKIKFLGKAEEYDAEMTAWYFLAQKTVRSNKILDKPEKYSGGVAYDKVSYKGEKMFLPNFRGLFSVNSQEITEAEKALQRRIEKIKKGILDIPFLKEAIITKEDAWENFYKLPEDSFVIFDSEYISEEKGKKVAEYGKKEIKQRTIYEEYTKDFDKLILPYLNKKNIKIVIHNNYTPELADFFAERGFLVYKTTRVSGGGVRGGAKKVDELIAINFDQQGKRLEVGKGIDNTQYLWAGLPLPLLGNVISSSKIYLSKLLEKVSTDVKGMGAKAFVFWISNPFHLEYVTAYPLAKEFGRKLKTAEFQIEEKIANKTKKIDAFQDLIKEKAEKLNKKAYEDLNEILWEANAKNVDPFNEIFQEKWKKFQEKYGDETYKQALEITNAIKELFKEYYMQEMAIRKGQIERLKEKLDEETYSMFVHLKDLEKDFFKKRNFYLPQVRRRGNISIAVEKGGKVVHYEEITDPSVYVLGKSILADRKVKELRKKFGDKVKINVYKRKEHDITDLWDGFVTLTDILERTDVSQKEKKKILEEAIEFIKAHSFRSHFKRRKDWEISGYIRDFGEAIRIYNSQIISHWWKYFWTEHLPELEKIAKKDATLWTNFERWHEQLMYNRDWRDKLVSMTRTFAFLKYLGLNFKFLFVQSIQNATFTPFFLAREIKNLQKVSSDKAFGLAYKEVAQAVKELITGEWKKDEIKRTVIEELVQRKVIASQRTAYFVGKTALLGRTWSKFQQLMGLFASPTEIFNRMVSAIAYLNTLKPEKVTTDVIYLTREFVYLANGKYGDIETPFILQGKDNLKYFLRAGFTFKTYNTQMLLGLIRLFKENEYKLLLYSLGILGLVGGIQSLPFYYTAKEVYEAVTDRSFDLDLLNWIGDKDFWGVAEKGIFTLTGIDISGSLMLETPVDDIFRSLKGEKNLVDAIGEFAFGIPYSMSSDLFRSFNELEKGNWEKALYYGLPVAFLRYPFKALGDRLKGITTDGNLIILDADGKPLKATEKEFVLQAVGFTPARLSEFKNLYFAYKGLIYRYQRKRQSLYARYRNAVNKNDFEEMIEVGNEMVELNRKIMEISRDYNIHIPYASLDRVEMINKQVDFLNFLRYNLQ